MNQRRHIWTTAVAALGAILLFVALSAINGGPGFPLDDSWIHQTYARNLAQTGQMAYVPGQVSAGSTSPLWTLLLALGYLLRLPYLLWAFLLGGLCLLATAVIGMALWQQLWPQQRSAAWAAGLTLALTWQLVWTAVSGMETPLFIALALLILWLYAKLMQAPSPSWALVALPGFSAGLLVLTRPEGLVLLVLMAMGWLLGGNGAREQIAINEDAGPRQQESEAARTRNHQSAMRNLLVTAVFLLATLLPLIPYFLFNYQTSGTLWPNTLYAKQAEYAAELARPFAARLAQLLYFSMGGAAEGWRGMSGAQLLLLPGLLWAGWLALRADWRARRLLFTLPLLWAGGHIFLYAWRLPVTYQHGRYLLAALPIWLLYGLAGWGIMLRMLPKNSRLARIAPLAARLVFTLLLLFYLLLGATAYATDVAFIEGEMVATAHWLAQNTDPDDLIAAHDIGAIGYFAQRPLLDLAGLISPEIIPLLQDEAALGAYILNSEARYLVSAPGWPYTQIIAAPGVQEVFNSGYAWTIQQGQNNTAVYRLPR